MTPRPAARGFPPAGPIYDIGGGNGFVARHLQAMGFDTVLVEPGLESARNARARGLRHVVAATYEEAGFRAGSFAGVGLFSMLEHLHDDTTFLQTITRTARRAHDSTGVRHGQPCTSVVGAAASAATKSLPPPCYVDPRQASENTP